MAQLYAVVSKLRAVCIKRFVLLRWESAELVKDVLSAEIRSGGVQAGF